MTRLLTDQNYDIAILAGRGWGGKDTSLGRRAQKKMSKLYSPQTIPTSETQEIATYI
jgi:hypothetical protein